MPVIVTVLSDFGVGSPYPAAMKAVVAACCDPLFIDISHEIPRHDVRAGAYLLSTIVPHTPAGTVHLAVVDPGVGTARRAIIVASGGQFFVGPDNGLLLPAARSIGAPRAFVITDESLLRAVRSSTFHGRDLFAPAAGTLARGTPPEALGAPAPEIVDLDFGEGRREGQALVGEIIYVDPFGNLITNIPNALLPPAGTRVAVGAGRPEPFAPLRFSSRRTLDAVVARTYGDVAGHRPVVVQGSDGRVEVAVREGSARERLAAGPGAVVRIVPRH